MAGEWKTFINYIFITLDDGIFLQQARIKVGDADRLNGQEISMLGHFVFGLMYFSWIIT